MKLCFLPFAISAILLAYGCGESEGPRGSAGSSGPGVSPGSGGNGATTAPGSTGGFDNPDPIAMGGQPAPVVDDCNEVEIEFAPRIPSVFILVDRSSSMFERNLWMPLKDGVLAVIDQLDQDIRFGFSSYTGVQGMMCPELSTIVPVAEQNFPAIQKAYDAIPRPQQKSETPTSLAITEIAKVLQSEPENTPKFIVLVTDGEPDFCDDPNVTCSRDAVVAAVQAAYAQQIGTFIFSVGGEVAAEHLGDVANAGTGQGVVDRQMAVQYQCPNRAGTYSATAGNAPYFEPDINDRAALVTALSKTIAGVRSCVFDLQGKVKIDLALADQGVVELDGMRVPPGGEHGFRMNSETQLELLGDACERLKLPETERVSIDFPCEAIEVW
jgi:uncharacterized protein YegL